MHYCEYRYMCILLVGYMTEEPNTVFIFVLLSKNFILHVNVCLIDTDTVLSKTCSSYSTNECSLNLTGKM